MSSRRKTINIRDNYWSFFGRRLVDLSDIKPGFRVLDVGTGAGACLIPAARKTGKRGRAIGIDINNDAIRRANENLRKLGIPNATAIEMDAKQMSYPEGDFDYVLCGFVGFGRVYNYEKKEYRLPNKSSLIMEEIHRVLKLGESAGFSNWKLQEEIETLRELTMKYLKESGRTPLKKISMGYSKEDEEGIQRLMTDAGFTNISVKVEDIDVIYNNDDEWFRYMLAHGIIQAAVGEELEDIKQTILSQIPESHRRANTLVFTKSVIYSHGTKTTGSPRRIDGQPTIRKIMS